MSTLGHTFGLTLSVCVYVNVERERERERERQSVRMHANSKSDNDFSILSDIYLQNLFSPSVAGLLHMQVGYLQ